jgi:BlaI family transcriptional regulator, penicillinase repressor
MRRRTKTLTEQELEIMKVIWAEGEATVRAVYEAILKQRPIAYTTVMTMMNILEQKGHLKKQELDRAFLYKPTRTRQQVIGSMVRDFVDRVLGGSAQPLLVHLVEDKKLTEEELNQIRELVRRKS